jgi:hypothetical protein
MGRPVTADINGIIFGQRRPMHLEAYEVVCTELSDGGTIQCAAHDEFSEEIASLQDVHRTCYETVKIDGREYVVAILPTGR